ncbi:MAG: hypothetical protein KDB80_06350 [Planctomycetes bacterium]|nr:hypothetical protein [Planctomycetota bacterium]
MIRRIGLVVLGLLVACSSYEESGPLWGERPAEGLDLRAGLSASEAPLFGPVEVVLDWFVGEGVDASFEPDVPDGFEGTVTAAPGVRLVDPAGEWRRFRLDLRPTELGELTIPPFQVTAGERTATTSELHLDVATVLEGQADELEAPAPLFPGRTPAWVWWSLGGALAALTILFWWIRRLRARPVAQPVEIAVPPHIKALRALARLRDAPRRTAAEVESFWVEVSQVLRVYLEDRFGLQAPERTTEEFLPEVERSGLLDAEQRAHLRRFLEQSDLVKFAAMQPGEDAHREAFAFAEGFVESTRPDRAHESRVEVLA